MYRLRKLLLVGPLLAAGCLYGARERTDQTVAELAAHPFDPAPHDTPTKDEGRHEADSALPAKSAVVLAMHTDELTTAMLQPLPRPLDPTILDLKDRIKIPAAVPGAETPLMPLKLPDNDAEKRRLIQQLYPPLPPLPAEAAALPGPDGKPYTLADLQHLAILNSPTILQAASDVEAARGNLVQARAYPNPTVGLEIDPSSDGSVAGVWGVFFDQPIKMWGKLRLASASAQMDLDNAEAALKRARSDLATQVRNAYFGLLVAKETVRITKAMAQFTDEVYGFQVKLVEVGSSTAYEPTTLRAQAYTARMAYKQSLQTYNMAWKQLVAAVGLRQLPLSEVAGRVDAHLPYYDYDTVLAHALRTHTDVITARNGLDKQRYNLKLAQITPWPDLDIRVAYLKEYVAAPEKQVHTVQIGLPIPLWDTNKGGIYSAEAALLRATEEPHRVELALTTNLALAYQNYRINLDALEEYRLHILPDQVRAYRGIFIRRNLDPGVGFIDLVTAQQTLAASVTQYLTVLSQVWTSVVSVADVLQTDDLFQLAEPHEVPPLPDLDGLAPLPCCHPGADAAPPPPVPLPPLTGHPNN